MRPSSKRVRQNERPFRNRSRSGSREVGAVRPAGRRAGGRAARSDRDGPRGTRRGDGGDRRTGVPGQAVVALDLSPGGDGFFPHVVDRAAVAGQAGGDVRDRPAGGGGRADQHGFDPQMAVPVPRRAGSGDGLYPRSGRGSRRGLYLEPGWLHLVVPVLPYRDADAGAQPGRAGDRRPVHGGAGFLWGVAVAERRDSAAAVHHRADGHGRAAV